MSVLLPAIQTGLTINDLSTTRASWYSYNTANYGSIVVQVLSPPGTAWVSGITVDIEMSLDGQTWSAFSTAQTYSSDGVKSKLDVQNISRVRARISKTSTDGSIRVIVYGGGDAP
jgi:hypothetical protein